MTRIGTLAAAVVVVAALVALPPCRAAYEFCSGQATHGYNATACDTASATCCKYKWAPNGIGCCPMPGAVCCANGYTCCPAGHTCQDKGSGWAVVTTCIAADEAASTSGGAASAAAAAAQVGAPAPPALTPPVAAEAAPAAAGGAAAAGPGSGSVIGDQICKLGAAQPFASGRRNCLIIGDSVSIGYTPPVAAALADLCDVQHSPWGGDGGACEAAYGLKCFDAFTTSPSGVPLSPDLIMFNWGLHNSGSGGVPGQAGKPSEYIGPLTNITSRLQALAAKRSPPTQLVFGITSPMICNKEVDDTVLQLNKAAAALMAARGIPTIDLHAPIVAKCGPVPQASCFGHKGCWCPHCPPAYAWLANNTIVPPLRKMLQQQQL